MERKTPPRQARTRFRAALSRSSRRTTRGASSKAAASGSGTGKRRSDPKNERKKATTKRSKKVESSQTQATMPLAQIGHRESAGTVRTSPLELAGVASAEKPPSDCKAASSARTDKTQDFHSDHVSGPPIGLVRISSGQEHVPPFVTATYPEAHVRVLVPGSILGRNASNTSAVAVEKIDLGIGPDATGVSRKQLEVVSVFLEGRPSMRVRAFPKTPNVVAIFRYDPDQHVMSARGFLSKGDGIVLRPGDVIVMDDYRRSDERITEPPCHIFRVLIRSGGSWGSHQQMETVAVLPPKVSKDDEVASNSQETQPSEEEKSEVEDGRVPGETAGSPTSKPLSPAKAFALQSGAPVIREPCEGDFFRVVFNCEATDVFACAPFKWYVGQAVSVETNKKKARHNNQEQKSWNIQLLFEDDNQVLRFVYPSDEVQILTPSEDQQRLFVEFDRVGESSAKTKLVYDKDPLDLYPGDLVSCFAQNGKFEDRQWYMARVLSVDKRLQTIDVLYDDGDCEVSVPMRQGKVILLERGFSDLQWLENKTVPFREGNQEGVIAKIGGYNNSSEFDKLRVKVVSNEAFEILSFQEIISSLREKAKQTLSWPDEQPGDGRRRKRIQSKPPRSKRVPKTKNMGQTPQESRRAVRCVKERMDDKTLWEVPDELPSELQEIDIAAIHPHGEPREAGLVTHASTLQPMLGNAAIRALNSAEPHIGCELLCQYLFVDGRMPQVSQLRKLFDLMKLGPQSNGTCYPDPSKMALTSDLVLEMVRSGSLSDNVRSASPQNWHDLEQFLIQVDAEIYCSETDFSSNSSASLSRVGKSLQVMACSFELIQTLMESQLHTFVGNSETIKRQEYQEVPIVKALRDQGRRDTRESLKFVLHALAKAWTRFGHFVLNEHMDKAVLSNVDLPSLRRCTDEATRCIDALGAVCCSTVWVYCFEQGVDISSREVAILVSTELGKKLAFPSIDLVPFFCSKADNAGFRNFYVKRSKLRLVRALNKDFARPLQRGSARILGISKEYAFIMGGYK